MHSVSWLIPVLLSEHWTLLELRWDLEQIRHYDSKTERDDAYADAYVIKKQARALLQILRSWFGHHHVNPDNWEWIGEKVHNLPILNLDLPCTPFISASNQRKQRQDNNDDCGPFVCADLVNLAERMELSPLTQSDVPAWRLQILSEIRRLEPRKRSVARASDFVGKDVIIID